MSENDDNHDQDDDHDHDYDKEDHCFQENLFMQLTEDSGWDVLAVTKQSRRLNLFAPFWIFFCLFSSKSSQLSLFLLRMMLKRYNFS